MKHSSACLLSLPLWGPKADGLRLNSHGKLLLEDGETIFKASGFGLQAPALRTMQEV